MVREVQPEPGGHTTACNRHWSKFRPSSWYRTDHASAAQPHGDDDRPSAEYWLAWPPYITGDRSDIGHPRNVMKHRFRTREAAMAYADKTWPLGYSIS